MTWWHDVIPMTWKCHDKLSFLLGIILLNMGNPLVHCKIWLLIKYSSMFETVLFPWKCNIFDGRYVILKLGQCWLFTCATCTAVCFVPVRRNFTVGDGVAACVNQWEIQNWVWAKFCFVPSWTAVLILYCD